jgi:hypothetical protein
MAGKDVLWSLTAVAETSDAGASSVILVGPAPDNFGNLDWRTVSSIISNEEEFKTGNLNQRSSTTAWTSSPLKYEGNVKYNSLWGNIGTMRAFDRESGYWR